nr:unnamed protein product [Spirometra erinaceieuropaei]
MLALSTNIPRADQPLRSSPDPIHQQPDIPTCCPLTATSPTPTATTILTTSDHNLDASPLYNTAIFIIPVTTYTEKTTTRAPTPATGGNIPGAVPTIRLTVTTSISCDADLVPHYDRMLHPGIGMVGHLRAGA